MLHIIQDLKDPLIRLLADDPVRPEIPVEFRVSASTEVFVLDSTEGEPAAVVCVAYRTTEPSTVWELAQEPAEVPTVAVFYTIWSYKPGAGRRLIQAAQAWIKQNRPEVRRYVTLSPPTEMARIFHLRNGAEVFRINSESVNYLYS